MAGQPADTDRADLDGMLGEVNRVFADDPGTSRLLTSELLERSRARADAVKKRQDAIDGGIWKRIARRAGLDPGSELQEEKQTLGALRRRAEEVLSVVLQDPTPYLSSVLRSVHEENPPPKPCLTYKADP